MPNGGPPDPRRAGGGADCTSAGRQAKTKGSSSLSAGQSGRRFSSDGWNQSTDWPVRGLVPSVRTEPPSALPRGQRAASLRLRLTTRARAICSAARAARIGWTAVRQPGCYKSSNRTIRSTENMFRTCSWVYGLSKWDSIIRMNVAIGIALPLTFVSSAIWDNRFSTCELKL